MMGPYRHSDVCVAAVAAKHYRDALREAADLLEQVSPYVLTRGLMPLSNTAARLRELLAYDDDSWLSAWKAWKEEITKEARERASEAQEKMREAEAARRKARLAQLKAESELGKLKEEIELRRSKKERCKRPSFFLRLLRFFDPRKR